VDFLVKSKISKPKIQILKFKLPRPFMGWLWPAKLRGSNQLDFKIVWVAVEIKSIWCPQNWHRIVPSSQ